jgi:hypothetical protein
MTNYPNTPLYKKINEERILREEIARDRAELRAMISGKVQFHADEFSNKNLNEHPDAFASFHLKYNQDSIPFCFLTLTNIISRNNWFGLFGTEPDYLRVLWEDLSSPETEKIELRRQYIEDLITIGLIGMV